MNIFLILIAVALFITLAILIVGVISMTRGGPFNEKYSNKLMRARVISQFITLTLILIYAFLGEGF